MTTKLHKNIVETIIETLFQIMNEGRYADKAIERSMKQNPKWGGRDRRFIAENCYNIVRWYRLLAFVAEVDGTTKEDIWKIFNAWCTLNDIELPTWVDKRGMKEIKIRERYEKAQKIRKIKESVPDWLDAMGEKELTDKWDKELEALNDQAPVIIRANTLKTTLADLQQKLALDDIDTETLRGAPSALMLNRRQNIFRSPFFKEGYFEVQDAASQSVSEFLQVEPGMRVIDACAGAGGKTLHLAALMQNKGKIIAMDPEQWKLDELKKRAKRAGANNIEVRLIDNTKAIKRLEEKADRLLLDVPCSGLGVLRRNPDAKWKLTPEFIENIRTTQQKILQQYTSMLKPGGKLVYATCSILPSEDEEQVQAFLDSNKNYTLITQKRFWPSNGDDGFYMALISKA